MTESIRAFIAVGLSDQAKGCLAQAINSLSSLGLSGVRWVRPGAMHATMKFLGNIDHRMVEKVTEGVKLAVQGSEPFTFDLFRTGAFPSLNNPRVLWVSLGGDVDRLCTLQQAVEAQMRHLGFAPEKRRFSPHVTLGRVRERTRPGERRRIGDAFSQLSVDDVVPWRVGAVELMRSTLAPTGAIYDALARIALAEE